MWRHYRTSGDLRRYQIAYLPAYLYPERPSARHRPGSDFRVDTVEVTGSIPVSPTTFVRVTGQVPTQRTWPHRSLSPVCHQDLTVVGDRIRALATPGPGRPRQVAELARTGERPRRAYDDRGHPSRRSAL